MNRSSAAGPIAIVGACLFDGQEFHADWTLVIDGGSVLAVGPQGVVQLPAGTTVIDGAGKTVVPGFIDMHTHVRSEALPLWLAYGITTVKDVGNSFDRVLPLRESERGGASASPRIYCCGPLIDGPAPFWPDHSIGLANEADAVRAADALAAKGVDACKTYMMLPVTELRAFVARAREHDLSTSAHLGAVSAGEAIDAGVVGLEHTAQSLYSSVVPEELIWPAEDRRRRGLGAFWANFVRGWAAVDLRAERPRRIADRLAAAGVYINPTLVTLDRTVERGRIGIEALDADPAMAEYSAEARSTWRATRDRFVEGWTASDFQVAAEALDKVKAFTAMLHENGATVHAATDAPFAYIVPGSSYLREIELLTEAGLSIVQALRCATSLPARTLGAADIGHLRAGAQADVIVFDGDLGRDLAAIRRIERVFKRGAEVDRSALFTAARSSGPSAPPAGGS